MKSLSAFYRKLTADGLDEDDETHKDPQGAGWQLGSILRLVHLSTTFLLVLLVLHLLWQLRAFECSPGDDRVKGYNTEWAPAREAIALKHNVRYSSAFIYNSSSGGYYREFDPKEPQYVGWPSPEIDHAWAELMKGQWVVLSEKEAKRDIENPQSIHGKYYTEVEALHTLHCLNALRTAVDWDYYSKIDAQHGLPLDANLRHTHIDHCIEMLRQNAICEVNLTPVPLRPFGDEMYIGFPQRHTCRDWDEFREWWTKRGRKTGVWESHAL